MALEQRAAWDGDAVPKPWRVVLVDDEDDIRALIRIMLRCDGRFDVVAEASNGSEAVEAIVQHRPDVVVLDLSMPVMDGVTALTIIKGVAPDCRVAVCSAHGESTAYALALGADAYIDKVDLHHRLTGVLGQLCASRCG
jgi:DNA-binding NarL/FixJ family response regulator